MNFGALHRLLTSRSVDAQLVTVSPLLALVPVHTRAVVGRERQAGGARAHPAQRRRHALILAF